MQLETRDRVARAEVLGERLLELRRAGPSVSQPERSVSATASRSCGCSCRSNSGSSGKVSVEARRRAGSLGDVLVARVVRVAEAALVERRMISAIPSGTVISVSKPSSALILSKLTL